MSRHEARRSHDASGTYRGIVYLVRSTDIPEWESGKFHEPAKTIWTHYIFIAEQQVPDAVVRDAIFLKPSIERLTPVSPERVVYHYSDCPLADLEWHCGITFYDLVCEVPGHRVLKAGCDYQHYWDEGHHYNEAICIGEAKATIDSLWGKWPGLLVRDPQTGKWSAPPVDESANNAPAAARGTNEEGK